MRGLYLHQRFFMLLWGGIFASLMAYFFPVLWGWVVWMLAMGGVVVVTDILLLYRFGGAVEARRMTGEKFANGEDNPVSIRLKNHYPFGIRARVIDEAPVEFQKRDISLEFVLSPGEAGCKAYSLHPVRRGAYVFGRIRVFVSSPLSFVMRRYSFEPGTEVAVWPSFLQMRKYELMAFAGTRPGSGVHKRRIAGVSTAFDQIQPYVQGDDPRTVNWKATAKCRRLMVNTYTEERSQQVYCLVDKGRTMEAPFRGMTVLDYAINATLALSDIILKKGDRAGLLTFAQKTGTLIKADSRSLQLSRINEALYNQKTQFPESDFEQLSVAVARQIRNRSLLVLFTNFDTVKGMKRHLPALKRLVRDHVLLLILFENSEIKEALRQDAVKMRDYYFKAVAGSFIGEKKQIALELRKNGVYTILTEPGTLTADVINAYLELKERGVV